MLSGTVLLAACSSDDQPASVSGSVDAPERQPGLPGEGAEELRFFSTEEARRVDAVVGRIIPGDENDPGAVQAGVTIYIDRKLDTFEDFADPAFMQEPHAEGVDGDAPPPTQDAVYVDQDQLYRYGYQSGNIPRQIYRQGMEGLERYAQTRFGHPFTELSPEQQDTILAVLDDQHQRSEDEDNGFDHAELDRAEEMFDPVDPGEFFEIVRVDTIEGMFADPIYGGNRNLAGWTLIGYPGAQRSYSPHEMMHGTNKVPVSLEGLTPMNPDRGDGRDALEQDHHHHVDRG